jgi:cytochrome P450
MGFYNFHKDSHEDPHGPQNILEPIGLTWRHYVAMRYDPISFFRKLAAKYEDLCFFRILGQRCYLVNHPSLIRDVLVRHHDDIQKYPRVMRNLRQGIGDSLLTSQGSSWKQRRTMLQKIFRSSQLNEVGQVTIDESRRILKDLNVQSIVPIEKAMNRLTQTIIARSFFGGRLDDPDRVSFAIRDLSNRFYHDSNAVFQTPTWLPTRNNYKKQESLRTVRTAIEALSQQRQSVDSNGHDVLGMLASALQGTSSLTDGGFTRQQALDELITLFVAGSHTSSVALAWTAYLIATHPNVQRKLHEEIDRVLADKELTVEDLSRLPYTTSVVQESLRLHPPAWELFARQTLQPIRLRQFEIPVGSLVFILPIVTHRDARFFPNPLHFSPDRFSAQRIDEVDPFAYLPFGAGPHTCLGKTMTMVQLPLILATLLRSFTLSLANPNARVRGFPRVSLRPTPDPLIRLSLRNESSAVRASPFEQVANCESPAGSGS